MRPRIIDAIVNSRAEMATSVWLLNLRWFAVIGQLITILASWALFTRELPISTLLVLVAFTAATNLVYAVWLRGNVSDSSPVETDAISNSWMVPAVAGQGYKVQLELMVAAGLMLVDLVTLSAMLHYSGGVNNPFAAFYFVNLAVAGVVLPPRWAWALTGVAVLAFSTLLWSYLPLEILEPIDLKSDAFRNEMWLRHLGEFVAFAACATVVTYFVTSTADELTRRERELRAAQIEHARSRQLESLSTLAAGAAHELATPMSTVLLIARELQRHLENVDIPESVREDLQLIDSELRLCRAILSRMRSAAGDYTGESWQKTTVGDLLDTVLEGIREPHRVEISRETERIEDVPLWLPGEAVAQAIRNLIHNGLDASGEKTVWVDISAADDQITLRVQDWGEGMDEEKIERLGQPFFTTKEPGRGMGLGLFLSRNVIRRLGGSLDFQSQPAKGTTAIVVLPTSSAVSLNQTV